MQEKWLRGALKKLERLIGLVVAWLIRTLGPPLAQIAGKLGPPLNWLAERLSRLAASLPLWLTVGLTASCLVVFTEVSSQLEAIQTNSSRAYGTSVFTDFKLNPADTADLAEALTLWRAQEDSVKATLLLNVHLLVDVVFVLLYGSLLFRALRRLGGGTNHATRVASRVSLMVVLFDLLETIWMLIVVWRDLNQQWVLFIAQLLSLAKWIGIVLALVSLLVVWRTPRGPTPSSLASSMRRAYRGGFRAIPIALSGLIVLVSLFAALVALPSGGPFEQLPDVLRSQIEDIGAVAFASAVALAMLVGCVLAAGWWATTPPPDPKSDQGTSDRAAYTKSVRVLVCAIVLSSAFWAVGLRGERSDQWVFSAPLVVFTVAWVVSKIVRVLTRTRDDAEAGEKEIIQGNIRALKQSLDDYAAEVGGAAWDSEPASARRMRWVSALGGAVVVIGAIGLVRASLTPALFFGDLPWWLFLTIGIVGAAIGGIYIQRGLVRLLAKRRGMLKIARHLVVWATLLAAILFAVRPDWAAHAGTTGTIAVAFGSLALLIGGASWLTGTKPPWRVTQHLRLGARTPWMTLLVIVWVVASTMNTTGGYHDARLAEGSSGYTHQHRDLKNAFDTWVSAQREVDGCFKRKDSIPMVLVAAPGGGIRAAYWTGIALDELFSEQRDLCAPLRVFAMSGVSGGSVGAAVWTASGSSRARTALREMARDEGLASAVAALFFRDLPASFTGALNPWADRAEVTERVWVGQTSVFGEPDEDTMWAEIGVGRDWQPVLTLNASSVTDGCRVLVTNTGGLPSTDSSDCFDTRDAARPVSGSIDPLANLRGWCAGEDCLGARAELPAITAAYLSARYPVVAPSGALHYGVHEQFTTYAVDGGYYENSLFTLLQIWKDLEPMVERHNACRRCPEIEPWIVLIDNHYRSDATTKRPDRPPEIGAIITALGNKGQAFSQPALEQMAIEALTPDGRRKAPGESTFLVIAPEQRPSVSAPLGWVLSEASQCDLHVQLDARLREGSVEGLLDALDSRIDGPVFELPRGCFD
jgi:hypothetical protein